MSTSDVSTSFVHQVAGISATAHPYRDDGGGHWVFGLFFFLILATLVATLAWSVFRRGGPGRRVDPAESGRRILAERFARGEIDVEEYQSRLGQLRPPR